MACLFKDIHKADVGDVLAFLSEAAARGEDAAVPAACLPLLSETARCRPQRAGGGGCYVFSAPDGARLRCGWLERATAAVALVLVSPLLFAIACAVVVFDGFPVFFRQERFGRDGAPFSLLKFRTMLRHSELLQGRLRQKGAGAAAPFKLARDPRVTRTGGFLRRTFLDELPQLVNVARGEMRWVGPRPLPASDAGCYRRPYHALRLKGMPGITGLWQVSGRNARTFDEMCLLDYYYVCRRSAALDVRIIGRTLVLFFKQMFGKREA